MKNCWGWKYSLQYWISFRQPYSFFATRWYFIGVVLRKKGHWCEHVSAWIRVNWFGPWVSQSFLTLGKELNKFFKFFFSFFRAFIASNVDICRSDSWYCLDNSFHDYDHFILCQNASLLLSIGFFKQTQTVRYWKVRFFKRTKKGDMFMQGVSSLSSDVAFFKNCRRLVCKTATH